VKGRRLGGEWAVEDREIWDEERVRGESELRRRKRRKMREWRKTMGGGRGGK
jgi:hypothetical protein